MFNYEKYKKRVQQYSEEKVKEVLYTTWYGNTWYMLLLAFLLLDIYSILFGRITYQLVWGLYFTSLFLIGLYLGTRKSSLALTPNYIVYVKYGHIGYKEKVAYEIMKDKIKSITVRKILNIVTVKISFISNRGKFETIKCLYYYKMIGPKMSELNQSNERAYKELKELEKVIDRGDF